MKKPRVIKFPKNDSTVVFDNIVQHIHSSFNAAQRHKRWRVYESLRCGFFCLIARDSLPHGKFLDWLRSDVVHSGIEAESRDGAIRSIQRYMSVATAFLIATKIKEHDIVKSGFLKGGDQDPKIPTVAVLNCVIAKEIARWVGNRGLYQIYVDCGIVREKPNHEQFHDRHPVDPEKEAQLEFEDIVRVVTDIKAQVRIHLIQAKIWTKLPKRDRQDLLDELVTVTNEIRESLKGR